MQDLVQVSGRYYNVAITSVRRTHNITDGDNAGRTKPPRALMIRDVIGTFIPYTIAFETKQLSTNEYDAFVAALVQPVDFVPVTLVYGQRSISFNAYITKVEDELVSNLNGVRRWGKLTVTFTPMEPNIRP